MVVSGARLDSTRRKQLEREALAKAVEDARLDAEALVKAANTRLGNVYGLSFRRELAALGARGPVPDVEVPEEDDSAAPEPMPVLLPVMSTTLSLRSAVIVASRR